MGCRRYSDGAGGFGEVPLNWLQRKSRLIFDTGVKFEQLLHQLNSGIDVYAGHFRFVTAASALLSLPACFCRRRRDDGQTVAATPMKSPPPAGRRHVTAVRRW